MEIAMRRGGGTGVVEAKLWLSEELEAKMEWILLK
jgi:hypothetical protein